MPSKPPPALTALPASFTTKKAHILETLAAPTDSYTDLSPKGSVDAQITGLIAQINALDGYVTTSSCAGRVSVFVEGQKGMRVPAGEGDGDADGDGGEVRGAGPGGKGFGGRWAFVSHDPVALEEGLEGGWMRKLGLDTARESREVVVGEAAKSTLRLVRLSFSPLILHVLCATLQHAKPLLASAVNAGFRESGVQSLKALDDLEAGVMVGIRTAGVAFETVVGWVRESDGKEEVVACVDEGYLRMCMAVVDGRFQENEERKERLRVELSRIGGQDEWEDKEVRRRRKREEGLRLRNAARATYDTDEAGDDPDQFEGGLGFAFD